jgi:transcriptional regulator with XRE-family HTH domain
MMMRGIQLQKKRKSLGWTQADLAARVGVTPNTVARWERDEVAIREPIARLLETIFSQKKSKKK